MSDRQECTPGDTTDLEIREKEARADKLRRAQRVIAGLQTDLLFTPGSQKSMTMRIDDIRSLLYVSVLNAEVLSASEHLADAASETDVSLGELGLDQPPFNLLGRAIFAYETAIEEASDRGVL